jgi:hypothetical protein
MHTQARVLLTGAGFTHNFGAPLASGISSILLAHPAIRESTRVRTALLNDPHFEDIYHEVMTEDAYRPEEKDAIAAAVRSAYDYIDETVRAYTFTPDAPYPVNIYGVQRFIDRFSGNSQRPGFFFTLNQDLFLERHYYNGTIPTMPGISGTRGFSSLFAHAKLNQGDSFTLPGPRELEHAKTQPDRPSFFYVKTHGSSNWLSSDGQQRMVIGHSKKEQIQREPMLAWYFELFNEVVGTSAHHLLTVGYGFGDDHINEVIANGVCNGLRLHILSPSPQSATRERVCRSHRGDEIWAGLYGYYPYTLLQLFPPDQSQTPAWNLLRTSFFESDC